MPEFLRNPDPEIYLSDNYSVVDFETDVIEKGSPHNKENQTLLASILNGPGHANPGLTRYEGTALDLSLHMQLDLDSCDYMVAHNARFELGWLDRGGYEIATLLPACTKVAEFCRAGNRRFTLDLASTLKRYGLKGKDPIGELIRHGVDTRSIPRAWLGDYCDLDVIRTEQLWQLQRIMMVTRGLLPVFFTRNILTPVLYDIEKRGVVLDKTRVDAVYAHHLDEQARLQHQWDELTAGVNPNSGPQVVVLLYGTKTEGGLAIKPPKDASGRAMTTDGGQPSIDKEAITRLKPTNKKQRSVVEALVALRAANQALSKSVQKLKDCSDDEGALYAEFNQTTAGTHRLSSKGRKRKFQLQNFPRDYRPCVRPRHEGWFIGDGDSAGIEFRTAVDLAKDDRGQQDIADKVDVHANTARITLADRWDFDAGEKEAGNRAVRQAAKADTFKPLYGGQSGTAVQRDYYAWFRERYSITHTMQEGWTDTVLKTKKLVTATGLIFYWPGCRITQDGKYIKYTTQIFDYPIQSFATAEMCPTATVYLWHMMRAARMESFLINLVHDSAVGEIHPDEREQWSEYMQYCFNVHIVEYLKRVYDYDWTTPLESEVKLYSHWDDSDPKGWDAQWST